MDYREVDSTSEYVCRLDHGADWRGEIEAFADEQGIDAGFFYGLGAVQDAEVWFYDQDRQEYDPVTFDEPLEVAACLGNVSHLDGDRFAHTHAVLSRPDGTALAGHLNSATVFAGELYVRAFDTHLERTHDEPTDLDLWEL
jgi:predicted DNA-binding protein with PD1-like motif